MAESIVFETELFKVDSSGRIRSWTVQVVEHEDATASLVMISGLKGFRMTRNTLHITEGKNIGRSNETTPLQQALKEANSRIASQSRDNYAPTVEQAEILKSKSRRPMLAHKFQDRAHDLPEEVAYQPKLNGVRQLVIHAGDEIVEISKSNKQVYHQFLQDIVKDFIRPGEEIDGEIYLHGAALRKITSAMTKPNDLTPSLEFHIFDAPVIGGLNANHSFKSRMEVLQKRMEELDAEGNLHPRLVLVSTLFGRKSEVVDVFIRHTGMDYEGTMVRDPDGGYSYGERSVVLQKYKERQDSEFPIVGAWLDRVGLLMFTCSLPNDPSVTFDVTPLGSDEERREMASKGLDSYTGKMLTVSYSMLLDSGIPEFAKGEAVRDYE